MLKITILSFIVLAATSAYAEGDAANEPESCTTQIIKALSIPDDSIPTMELDWGIPETETIDGADYQYKDGFLNYSTEGSIVVATMRCYLNGSRAMKRIH